MEPLHRIFLLILRRSSAQMDAGGPFHSIINTTRVTQPKGLVVIMLAIEPQHFFASDCWQGTFKTTVLIMFGSLLVWSYWTHLALTVTGGPVPSIQLHTTRVRFILPQRTSHYITVIV